MKCTNKSFPLEISEPTAHCSYGRISKTRLNKQGISLEYELLKNIVTNIFFGGKSHVVIDLYLEQPLVIWILT